MFWRPQSGRPRKETENEVKKKIRAIQYGVGPIGASIARLMREKQAIEIIGAIDTDPAKVGRDLGEVGSARRTRRGASPFPPRTPEKCWNKMRTW